MGREGSVFNDPVHGYIYLDEVLVSIIHTPQFQRLKDIKQLGATYWVYPGASHNRFEHSLGTGYLAGKMIETLCDIHKDENWITPEEVMCVKIAGLCHDIGHGPFSHVFDRQIKKKLIEKDPKNCGHLKNWQHEKASCDMFDYMLKENPKVQEHFRRNNIGEEEVNLIKEIILGKKPGKDKVKQSVEINGKAYPKWFLFEIVANKRNEIDCDKFDYFARDCLNLGVKSNFDHTRYLQNIRILNVDGQLQICAREKLVFNIYEMFHTRWSLHHRVYQHKTTKAIEDMISEVFALVDYKFEFSKAVKDMEKYTILTDSVLYEILRCNDEDERIVKAKEIVKKLQCRELYKFCGETQPSDCGRLEEGPLEIAEEIASFSQNVNPSDIYVNIVDIDFGKKGEDPIASVVFFNKDMDKAILLRNNVVSEMLPQKFKEQYIRVYAKNLEKCATSPSSKEKDLVTQCFLQWCKSRKFPTPDPLIGDKTGYFTPAKKAVIGKRSHGGDDSYGSKKQAKKELF